MPGQVQCNIWIIKYHVQWSTRVQNKGRIRAQGLKAEELQGGIVVLLLHVISFSQTSRHFCVLFLFQKKYFNFRAFKHCKKNAMCLEGRDEFYFNLLLNPEIKAISQTQRLNPQVHSLVLEVMKSFSCDVEGRLGTRHYNPFSLARDWSK